MTLIALGCGSGSAVLSAFATRQIDQHRQHRRQMVHGSGGQTEPGWGSKPSVVSQCTNMEMTMPQNIPRHDSSKAAYNRHHSSRRPDGEFGTAGFDRLMTGQSIIDRGLSTATLERQLARLL